MDFKNRAVLFVLLLLSGPRTYTIPNGVETVCDSAFEDSYVEKVYFPNTVKKMIGDVFHYCERLKYVKLNEGITSIGS